MARTGVGIVGAGVISNEYLKNLTTFPHLEVRFIADLDTGRASAQAKEWGVPGSGTYEELLADDSIQIVVNLTIPAVHVEVALQAVQAGKHVWGEKPYALDMAGGRALMEAAREAGVRVSVAPDTFLGAGLQTALRNVRDGAIGRPLNGITLFQVKGPESWHPSPEIFYARGGGPLFDVGPYYLTTLVQVFGPVSRVSATASTARETRVIGSGPRAGSEFAVEVPTHVNAMYEFESGTSAQSVFSFDSKFRRAGFVEISGTEGTAVFPDPNRFDGQTKIYRDSNEPTVVEPKGAFSTRGTGVAELAEAILEGRDERATGALAFHVLEMMIATSDAAESGNWVEVSSTVAPSELLAEDWDPTRAHVEVPDA